MAQVNIFKLVSGQEIIARLNGSDSENLVIEHPLAIQPRMTEKGFALALIPFSFGGVADKVTIPRKHILCVMDAETDLETQYTSSITGLILPQGAAGSKIVLSE